MELTFVWLKFRYSGGEKEYLSPVCQNTNTPTLPPKWCNHVKAGAWDAWDFSLTPKHNFYVSGDISS